MFNNSCVCVCVWCFDVVFCLYLSCGVCVFSCGVRVFSCGALFCFGVVFCLCVLVCRFGVVVCSCFVVVFWYALL